MAGLAFGSQSETRTKQLQLDQSITAAGQAIVNAPRQSGNSRNFNNPRIRLAKGATLNIGLTQEDLTNALDGLASHLTPQPATTTHDSGFDQALDVAMADRVEQNEALARDTIQESKPSNVRKYLVWGGVAIAVVGVSVLLIKIFRKGK
jgi:hypothetical protein